jgi:hypothetical protein
LLPVKLLSCMAQIPFCPLARDSINAWESALSRCD